MTDVIRTLGSAPFEVRHYHPAKDILGWEPEVNSDPGFYAECTSKTEYGPGLVSKEDLGKLPEEKRTLYETAFTAESYYCTLCNKRVAYMRRDDSGRWVLHSLGQNVAVNLARETEREVNFNEALTQIYGIFADLLGAEEAKDERLLLAIVRDLYRRRLDEAKEKLLVLLNGRRRGAWTKALGP